MKQQEDSESAVSLYPVVRRRQGEFSFQARGLLYMH
jgi:copper homeostasis protein CutC